jgi:AcrR family transcriptional regulator
VIDVVGTYGFVGTTVSRVAAQACLSEGSLYVHFATREDMIRAALESIHDRWASLIDEAPELRGVERLKHMIARHSQVMNQERETLVLPWIEFVTVGRSMGFGDAVADVQTRLFQKVLDIVTSAQAEGTIRSDMDARRLAWGWYAVAWAENITTLMVLPEFVQGGHSLYLMDLLADDAVCARLAQQTLTKTEPPSS